MNDDEALHLAIAHKLREKETLPSFRDETFPLQDAFVVDDSRFLAAQCSRRAGKTSSLGLKYLKALYKHPRSLCLYIALTRESAENIMWGIMQELDDRFNLGLVFTDSNLTITHPTNEARLKLVGADMKNFIKRLRGIKSPAIGIDESQDFGVHLKSLVDDILTPALTDYDDSWLALTGTPGPVPLGYFYQVTQERKFGFSLHKWTLLDNPYLPHASKFIEELKVKREWTEDNPTLRREWRNEWVLDLQSLLIQYEESKSNYSVIPNHKWTYILGVDLGLRDSDALALLAWSPADPNIYLVDEVITSGQDITSLVAQITALTKVYDISKIVVDYGGLGAKIAEEIQRRHHIPLQAADKARKMENVALLNDWLRLGKFKAKASSKFATDSRLVQIDWEKTTPDRIKVKDSYHSDIIDAVLYAFKESPAYTYTPGKPVHKVGSREWEEEETDRMFQAELEKAERELKAEKLEDWI